MADARYVYLADAYRLSRKPLGGGSFETLQYHLPGLPGLAQDAGCVYFATASWVTCISKADDSQTTLVSLEEGRVMTLAMSGSDLYFDVHVDASEGDAHGWLGRLACETHVLDE
jgi:hypothetical protein